MCTALKNPYAEIQNGKRISDTENRLNGSDAETVLEFERIHLKIQGLCVALYAQTCTSSECRPCRKRKLFCVTEVLPEEANSVLCVTLKTALMLEMYLLMRHYDHHPL